jgi:hypothetical protein
MTIAIFKPIADALGEGEVVWGKLVQKVVDEIEHAEHIAAGWFTSAHEALEAADVKPEEKVDGRTKAARDAKKDAS